MRQVCTHRLVLSLLVAGLFCLPRAQSTEDLMSAGQDLLRNGAYAQAIPTFKKVLMRDPSNFEAQFNLGFAYLNSGRNQNALEELRKASGMNPSSGAVWANMGVAYQNTNENGRAIEAFTRAINLEPQNISARLNLASMYFNVNKANEAISQYKEILSIDSKNGPAAVNLARLLVTKERSPEAKAYLQAVIDADANNADALHELGKINWKQEKKYDLAEKNFRAAIAITPALLECYDDLGSMLEEMGNKNDAKKIYQSALVYADDVLQKESLQKRIDKIDNPDKYKNTKSSSTSTSTATSPHDEMQKMKRDEDTGTVGHMDVGNLNVSSDLSDLAPTDNTEPDFKAAAKLRAKGKK